MIDSIFGAGGNASGSAAGTLAIGPGPLMDLLLPATDAGVLAQLITLFVLTAIGLLVTRRRPEWRLVVIGAALSVLGFFAIRAVH